MTDFNFKDEKKKDEDVKEEELNVPKDAYGNHDPDKAAPGGYNVAPSVGPVPGVGEEKDEKEAKKDEADHDEKLGNVDKLNEPDKKFQPEDKLNDPTLPQDAAVKKPKNKF